MPCGRKRAAILEMDARNYNYYRDLGEAISRIIGGSLTMLGQTRFLIYNPAIRSIFDQQTNRESFDYRAISSNITFSCCFNDNFVCMMYELMYIGKFCKRL
jgi:hypothetical protein